MGLTEQSIFLLCILMLQNILHTNLKPIESNFCQKLYPLLKLIFIQTPNIQDDHTHNLFHNKLLLRTKMDKNRA